MPTWKVELIPEAREDFNSLDGSVKKIVLKQLIKLDKLVKSLFFDFSVIMARPCRPARAELFGPGAFPARAKAGIQCFQCLLDPGVRRGDGVWNYR